ncbi:MAG: deoxycytidylate deaminase [Sulfuricurvum sp.]|nr:deoxycytidylate deaminase [Sulfuricurvum sp.]
MIDSIYSNRKNFIVIGMTGRIGSGCTSAADFLSQNIDQHNLQAICIDEGSTDAIRKKYIINKFYKKNWVPFTKIRATDIITTFLLKYDFDDFNLILKDFYIKVNEAKKDQIEDNPLYTRLRLYGEILTLDDSFKDIYNQSHEKFKNLHNILDQTFRVESIEDIFQIITTDLIEISDQIKNVLSKESYKNYTDIFQLLGDNIRLYGDIKINESKKNANNIYEISKRINSFIKIIRGNNDAQNPKKPTLIVIDAIRNSLESMFFQERYSAFYLVAINALDEDIEDRLLQNINMTREDIKKQSKKEHQDKTLKSLENFVSQNIQDCIAKSDIFIVNNGKYNSENFLELYGQLIKYLSLIMHPGLITPSLDEKMMQVAYTAKLNSGCLSRQVGASITNESGSLKAIGWNSVAEGQTSCMLRSSNELLSKSKSVAYSSYEQSKEFRDKLSKKPFIDSKYGLNQSFCFKSIYTEGNQKEQGNQVHTRSLHAEENAFLQLAKYGSEGIKGGTLYSTASPCELCAKKAYQLGMKKIVYIDPYPGIAKQQILMSGQFPPDIILFKGAIGTAYHKLYEQIIPYKDELENLWLQQ